MYARMGLPRLDALVLMKAVREVLYHQDVLRHLLSRNPVTGDAVAEEFLPKALQQVKTADSTNGWERSQTS